MSKILGVAMAVVLAAAIVGVMWLRRDDPPTVDGDDHDRLLAPRLGRAAEGVRQGGRPDRPEVERVGGDYDYAAAALFGDREADLPVCTVLGVGSRYYPIPAVR